ncbi:MAG: hypothetical protein V3R81_13050 [Gammaproteobacteria bacterium]
MLLLRRQEAVKLDSRQRLEPIFAAQKLPSTNRRPGVHKPGPIQNVTLTPSDSARHGADRVTNDCATFKGSGDVGQPQLADER